MKKHLFRVFTVSILALALMVGAGWGIGEARPTGGSGESVEILIGFKGAPGSAERDFIESQGGKVVKELSQINILLVEMPERAAGKAMAAWSQRPNIVFVEENGMMYAHGQTIPWGIERIEAPAAHSVSIGTGIGIAIIDTGIDPRHEDLRVVGGYATVNCFPPAKCAAAWDDDHGHGTHVAGTAAALDNDRGVLGVAPEANLYAVKVLDRNGGGTWAGVAEGIIWAADQGIEVLNMSLGGGHSSTVQRAVVYAHGEGSLLVASAGNSGGAVGYPAAYAEVIAVSATDKDDNIASWSSRGEEVELAAPGVSVYSTLPGNKYGTYSGTSMASPHVAGVAALVWATDSTLTNEEVRQTLQKTAEDLGLSSSHQGYGLVRADLAVGAEPAEPPATHTLYGTVTDINSDPIENATVIIEDTDHSASTDSSGYYIISDVEEGTYTMTASKSGYISESNNITVDEDKTVNFVLKEDTEEPIDLSIDKFDLTKTSNRAWARMTIDWAVSGENLSTVEIEINGPAEGYKKYDVSGSEASGSYEFRARGGHGNYEVTLTVTDADGNSAPETKSINL